MVRTIPDTPVRRPAARWPREPARPDRHGRSARISAGAARGGRRTPGPGPRRPASVPASAQTWVTGSSGSGSDQRPAVVLEHLDPVHQHQVTALRALDQGAHDHPLLLPRGDAPPGGRCAPAGSSATSLESCSPVGGQHGQQIDQGGGGVVGGQEAGEDEPARLAGGEGDPLGAGHLHQVGRPTAWSRRSRRPAFRQISSAATAGRHRQGHPGRRGGLGRPASAAPAAPRRRSGHGPRRRRWRRARRRGR